MKKIAALLVLLAGAAHAEPVAFKTRFGTFMLPLQAVNGTQLYSFKEGKGYPALESVLYSAGRKTLDGGVESAAVQVVVGAAPVLGTSENVPYLGLQTRLPARLFDTSDNVLRFGLWAGKPSDSPRWTWGVKASAALW